MLAPPLRSGSLLLLLLTVCLLVCVVVEKVTHSFVHRRGTSIITVPFICLPLSASLSLSRSLLSSSACLFASSIHLCVCVCVCSFFLLFHILFEFITTHSTGKAMQCNALHSSRHLFLLSTFLQHVITRHRVCVYYIFTHGACSSCRPFSSSSSVSRAHRLLFFKNGT